MEGQCTCLPLAVLLKEPSGQCQGKRSGTPQSKAHASCLHCGCHAGQTAVPCQEHRLGPELIKTHELRAKFLFLKLPKREKQSQIKPGQQNEVPSSPFRVQTAECFQAHLSHIWQPQPSPLSLSTPLSPAKGWWGGGRGGLQRRTPKGQIPGLCVQERRRCNKNSIGTPPHRDSSTLSVFPDDLWP